LKDWVTSKDGKRFYLLLIEEFQQQTSFRDIVLIPPVLLSIEQFRSRPVLDVFSTASNSYFMDMDLVFQGHLRSKRRLIFKQLTLSLIRVLQAGEFHEQGQSVLCHLAYVIDKDISILGFFDTFFDQFWIRRLAFGLSYREAFIDTVKYFRSSLIYL
jgi:hypothetical protein